MKVLIVDDDPKTLLLLSEVAGSLGYDADSCESAVKGLKKYEKHQHPIIMLDWILPELNGLEFCKKIRKLPDGSDAAIIMITSKESTDDLTEAMEAGADDYILKSSINLGVLKVRLKIAEKIAIDRRKRKEAERELAEAYAKLSEKDKSHGLVGTSDPIGNLRKQISDFSKLNWTVLVEGETGTGKELTAKAIHFSSDRKEKPFIAVNTAGLSDSLLQSQLFGHKRGAFTGAVEDHPGLFESANGGTLFLDEIGDISPNVQVSLLRVLEDMKITRLGESKERKIDVRFITATNKNLMEEVEKGNFRNDLLYRIRVARINVPPLRERRTDIPLLTEYFLAQSREATGKTVLAVSDSALRIMIQHHWPGNIRELKSAIDYAVVRSQTENIEPSDLPPEFLSETNSDSTDIYQKDFSKMDILEVIQAAGGNRAKAAKLMGISRATLYRRLSKKT